MPRTPRLNQRKRIYQKCGGRCWYCGDMPEELTVDHAHPSSRGGQNRDENLLPACEYCNNLKASQTVAEFRKTAKVRLIRWAMEHGYYAGDLSRIRVVFFGEGNNHPFLF